MKKISLAVGLALAMAALVLAWGAWGGARVARGAAPPAKPLTSTVSGTVVINEVAWMGTQASTADEWIELCNAADQPITLTGWTLSDGGDISVTLSGVIPAGGYFLLERTDDGTISDVPADQPYSGNMGNSGETLTLRDDTGIIISTANGDGEEWPAGDIGTKATMERIDPTAPDTDDNWATNDGTTRSGHDADGNPINGTPKCRNSATAPAADLVVLKDGPATAEPEDRLTYTIRLRNAGNVTTTGLLVTDTLPSGVTFVTQTSVLTFSRPAKDTLIWTANALPVSTTFSLMTVVVEVDAGQTQGLVNVVTATSGVTEAQAANNTAWLTTALGTPVVPYVRLYALHPWALHSGDEAVALINLGAVTATLTGWQLGDGDLAPNDPKLPDAELPPGGILWITNDADDFYHVFGFDADAALTCVTHTVPLLDGKWPGFANDGDEAILYDDAGQPVDTLVYGDGVTTTTGWNSAAVPYPRAGFGDGQILYCKLDQVTGLPVPDTDTAADWAQAGDDDIDGKKVRYPGWDLEEFFFPAQITQTAALTVWVAPDGLYEGIAGLLQQAQSSVLIEGYTFESAELAGVITSLLRSGVPVTMLLEGQPASGPIEQELWACGQMADAGANIYFMHNNPGAKIFDRYDYQHAKFIIVDGQWVLIGSENLSPGGMPADDKTDGTWGHRGVYVATDAPGVVVRAQAIFDRDLDSAHSDIVPWGSSGYTAPTVFTPTYSINQVTYTARFSQPLILAGEFAFEAIQSPENSLRDRDALLGLLAHAGSGDTILVEQLYEHRFWGGDTANGPNPRLAAYIEAARRGATVHLLLDSRYDEGDNRGTADYVNGIAQSEGLDLEARLGNPTGEGIHNKMVLAWIGGQGYIHVGSINGSEAASKVNRGLALQVQSNTAYDFLKDVFDYDWQASWQSAPGLTHVYLPLVARNCVPPADHLVISELLYDPADVADADGEWIEIYNPTAITVTLTGYSLSDGNSHGDGTAAFPGGSIAPGGVIVIAQRAEVFSNTYGLATDFEFKVSDPAVPDMTLINGRIGWGNGGDEAILRHASGEDVDVVVYGSGSYPGATPHPGVGWGHSLERKPANCDTDDCSADFGEQYTPNPGQVTLN